MIYIHDKPYREFRCIKCRNLSMMEYVYQGTIFHRCYHCKHESMISIDHDPKGKHLRELRCDRCRFLMTMERVVDGRVSIKCHRCNSSHNITFKSGVHHLRKTDNSCHNEGNQTKGGE